MPGSFRYRINIPATENIKSMAHGSICCGYVKSMDARVILKGSIAESNRQTGIFVPFSGNMVY